MRRRSGSGARLPGTVPVGGTRARTSRVETARGSADRAIRFAHSRHAGHRGSCVTLPRTFYPAPRTRCRGSARPPQPERPYPAPRTTSNLRSGGGGRARECQSRGTFTEKTRSGKAFERRSAGCRAEAPSSASFTRTSRTAWQSHFTHSFVCFSLLSVRAPIIPYAFSSLTTLSRSQGRTSARTW